MNKIITVKSSNLPISIRKEAHHLLHIDILSNENAGPKSPKAGPTFPRLEAATPMEVIKSNPKIEKPNAPMMNEIMYKMKKP